MKPVHLGFSLLVSAMIAACGDATPPDQPSAADPTLSAQPDPADILAALPHDEARPYGLDVYTAHCLNCHGNLGQGIADNPPLRGLTPPAMQKKLLDYRAGAIKGAHAAAMAKAVATLSDAEIAAVSVYAGE